MNRDSGTLSHFDGSVNNKFSIGRDMNTNVRLGQPLADQTSPRSFAAAALFGWQRVQDELR